MISDLPPRKACIWKNKKNTETTYCHILISYFQWGAHDDRMKIREHQMTERPRASVTHTAAINMRWLCIKNYKTDQIINSLVLESEIMWQCCLKHWVQYKYNMSRKDILVPSLFTLSLQFQMGCLMPLCHEETLCWVLVGDLCLAPVATKRVQRSLSLSLSLSLSQPVNRDAFISAPSASALGEFPFFFSLSFALSIQTHCYTHTISKQQI